MDNKCIKAYVDGSFRKERVGWAVIIVKDDEILHRACGCLPKKFNVHRQIGGELKAAMVAAQWAKRRGVEISIYYDYTGIEKWATKEWAARKPMTEAYTLYMDGKPVKFVKVKAHSGDKWNDYVDEMAWTNIKIEQG